MKDPMLHQYPKTWRSKQLLINKRVSYMDLIFGYK